LLNAGRLDQAREEAAWCVRFSPGNPEYASLLTRIIQKQKSEEFR
jgi:hypothetical protein